MTDGRGASSVSRAIGDHGARGGVFGGRLGVGRKSGSATHPLDFGRAKEVGFTFLTVSIPLL